MKKKIAVFANGWNSDNLHHYMEGLYSSFAENSVDFFVFFGHDTFGESEEINKAEECIYSLADLKQYDGVIFFGPGLNYKEVNDDIIRRCREANVPTVCISSKYDDTIRVYTDNYEGMRLVAMHLVEEHNVKKPVFIAGTRDSEESNDRLRAVKDVFNENNISLSDDDIFYSDWEVYTATEFVRSRYSHGEPLPDAIICANDNTAFFVSLVLEDLGIDCPGQIIVTGFDGTDRSRSFYPSITTAAQPFNGMGVKTAECFADIFAGKSVKKEYYIPATFRHGESCGCDLNGQSDILRRRVCRVSQKDAVFTDFQSYRVHYMGDAVLKSKEYSTLGKYLQEYFYDRDSFEGNPFYILMDRDFCMIGEKEVEDFPKFHMTDTYDVLVGKHYDEHMPTMSINIKDGLVPNYRSEGPNHMYVIMPIYYKSYVCGYMIMTDKIDYFDKKLFSFFKSGYNRILDTYRKNLQLNALNIKLSELMNKDPMTSTGNRISYESYKKELQEQINNQRITDIAFIMFDINNLKLINDSLGHERGDEYIKNSCSLICTTFKHSPVFRIGGDEFVVVLKDKDYDRRDDLLKELNEALWELEKAELPPEKKVSFAFGVAIYDKNIDSNIDETIKRADNSMYVNKRMMKGML